MKPNQIKFKKFDHFIADGKPWVASVKDVIFAITIVPAELTLDAAETVTDKTVIRMSDIMSINTGQFMAGDELMILAIVTMPKCHMRQGFDYSEDGYNQAQDAIMRVLTKDEG